MQTRLFALALLLLFSTQAVFAQSSFVNDARNLFISKRMVIYALNIRSFNAQDDNNNDIVEVELGEVSGNFINAEKRLDEISSLGFNTIYLLPITKTGKLKAMGTAGSVYAMDSFDTISPLLDDKTDERSVFEEAQFFVSQAHKKGLRVILDMPGCGSYDMSLERPDLFLRNKDGEALVPADWTDVRLFKVWDGNELNRELVESYKKFIDMALKLEIDGVRANAALNKPPEFWKELISYARSKSPQFLFLAEAEVSLENPIKGQPYTSIEKILEAGFDGYYGDYSKFSELTKAKDFIKKIKTEEKIAKKFDGNKAVIASFATHDQQSPMLHDNKNYWETILWLSLTMPLNTYFLDGFQTGDNYVYKYENKSAEKSYTDDDIYFIHRGKFDIFNLSRKPGGEHFELYEIFKNAMKFKTWSKDTLQHGKMTILKTNQRNVFAYSRDFENDSVIVVGNLDSKNSHSATVQVKGLSKKSFFSPIKINNNPTVKRRKLETELKPSEIQVYMFSRKKLRVQSAR